MATGDVLFDTVTRWNGGRNWGKFLDAGTGAHSLRWLSKLETVRWDAITADEQMRQKCFDDKEVIIRPTADHVLTGNWMDPDFCSKLPKDYDTILADYLIGAVDGFSPYTQDLVISQLRNHLNVNNGRLYVIGMNPIPDKADGGLGEIVCEVRRARDACILLANHRPYREYPLEWMKRHLTQSGFKVLHTKNFTILHSEESIMRQIRVASSKLPLMPPSAKYGMDAYLKDLAQRVKATIAKTENGKIPLSFDYVIEASVDPTLQINNNNNSQVADPITIFNSGNGNM